jgi:hypothetical protein
MPKSATQLTIHRKWDKKQWVCKINSTVEYNVYKSYEKRRKEL